MSGEVIRWYYTMYGNGMIKDRRVVKIVERSTRRV